MFADIDIWLMGHVFQPLATQVNRFASCRSMAGFVFVMSIVGWGYDIYWNPYVIEQYSSVAMIVLTCVNLIRLAETPIFNPSTIIKVDPYRGLLTIFICFLLPFSAAQFSLYQSANTFAWILYIIAYYLKDCDPSPPAHRIWTFGIRLPPTLARSKANG